MTRYGATAGAPAAWPEGITSTVKSTERLMKHSR
jgi:hypothetical protein